MCDRVCLIRTTMALYIAYMGKNKKPSLCVALGGGISGVDACLGELAAFRPPFRRVGAQHRVARWRSGSRNSLGRARFFGLGLFFLRRDDLLFVTSERHHRLRFAMARAIFTCPVTDPFAATVCPACTAEANVDLSFGYCHFDLPKFGVVVYAWALAMSVVLGGVFATTKFSAWYMLHPCPQA